MFIPGIEGINTIAAAGQLRANGLTLTPLAAVVFAPARLYSAVMPADAPTAARDFDIIVWGASGFTGRLVVEYLAEKYPPDGALRWAVAGRNRGKLEEILAHIAFAGALPAIVIADSHDKKSMDELASRARVVLTTVGPYAIHGSELVAACVAAGTHYCDLCGEVQWMRRMIDRHNDAAQGTGARIVMSCGFDSIPSDIGVYCLHEHAMRLRGQPCSSMTLLVRAMKGGASGGTFASMLNAIEEARRDRSIAKILADPYALNPAGERQGPDGRDQSGARFDADAGVWTAPFVMAMVNTRVVRRSNALLGYRYGKDFRYREATITGSGAAGRVKSAMTNAGLKAFLAAAAVPLTRKQIVQRLLPAPGEGPSREQRENGYFNLVMLGRQPDGEILRLRIKGDRDPGYGSTSKMLAESAVCLATGDIDVAGGLWTPAAAMGRQLLPRLTANAGLSFEPE